MSFPSFGDSFQGQTPAEGNNGAPGPQPVEGQQPPPMGQPGEGAAGQFQSPTGGPPGTSGSAPSADGSSKTTLW